jgi:hypothetical protein
MQGKAGKDAGMNGYTIRGVPRALARDAWWMAPERGAGMGGGAPVLPDAAPVDAPELARPDLRPALMLALGLGIVLVLADFLVWQTVSPRLSLVALAAVVLAAGQVCLPVRPSGRCIAFAWGGLVLGSAPMVEQAGLLPFLFLWAAVLHGLARLALGDHGGIVRAILRLPFLGLWQEVRDGHSAVTQPTRLRPSQAVLWRLLRDWWPAAVLGVVFLLLFGLGNPLIDSWLQAVLTYQPEISLDVDRIAFWLFITVLFWPALRLAAMRSGLTAPPYIAAVPRLGLLDIRNVARALLTLNLLFAVQSVTDILYLWGGVRLPDGMTHAEYAHRGAYPLVVTALLAGAFALAANRHVQGHKGLRGLLLLWVVQNVLLMASSVLRLDLYVTAFGLSYLRFAAFVWMGLVAAGLCLMLWQIARGLTAPWMIRRSLALAGVTLWACCFVNVGDLVAKSQLARPADQLDPWYVCSIGEGALPAILAHEARTGADFCTYPPRPVAFVPRDWREWGYRNARLRHSLAGMEPVALPRAGAASAPDIRLMEPAP